MIRILDILFSLTGLILLFPVLVVLYVIGLVDTGSPIFSQERVGKHKMPFVLYKFRSMKIGTQSVGTHLASADAVTAWGGFLRASKLDELPQLWNVLLGDMSLVGPRPCLFNQKELIEERQTRAVFTLLPGITGWAQINRIDMSDPVLLAKYDAEMVDKLNLRTYFSHIFYTLAGRGFGDRIRGKGK